MTTHCTTLMTPCPFIMPLVAYNFELQQDDYKIYQKGPLQGLITSNDLTWSCLLSCDLNVFSCRHLWP